MRTALLASALVALAGAEARAETYNFYFDNANPRTTSKAELDAPRYETNFQRDKRWSSSASAFYGSRNQRAAAGLGAAMNVAILEWLRAQAFAGASLNSADESTDRAFWGAEAQLLPLHFPLGPSRRALDLGVAVGFSTFHKVNGNPGSFHLGPAVSARLNERFSVVTTVRVNLGSVMGDAGLAIRL